MPKDIYDIAVEFYGRVEENPEAKEVLKSYDQVYQFEIKDGAPFYLEVQGGKLSVHRGETSKTYYSVTKILVDQETLKNIFEGKITPSEAHVDNKWYFMARAHYEGLFTLLTRIGQDIVRKEVISRFKWE